MKRIISLIFCATLMIPGLQALAFNYPSGFWSLNSSYESAMSSGDNRRIIEYGNRIISLVSPMADSREKRSILVSRYDRVGKAYAALNDYDNAAATYRTLYEYASAFGDEFYDYAHAAKARALQYTPEITMYMSGGASPYYGAVNEKNNGVLFGVCANGGTRSRLGNESMVLTYQELGQSLIPYNTGVMRDASSGGYAVEFALNCPREGNDIKDIMKMDRYLNEISELFKKYPKVPVYLRFAAEFDIWSTQSEPEEFKTAFRHVSRYFKDRNSNVAVVWSPNQVSNWYVDIDDYYPGDEYVDWVGISGYAQKYFLGDKNQKEENEIVFRTGINSDPVLAVRDIVEKYGAKKPIMLAESGCGHKLVKSGEDTTGFALQRLKEYYSYLPMVYPQIKLIAYFDWHIDSAAEHNDFRLSSNSALQNEFLKLVKGQRFIQDKYGNSTDLCYRRVADGTETEGVFEAACYAHLYNATPEKVTYFIDDKYVAFSEELPFTAMVDASAYSGDHRLKAVAAFDNGRILETSSNIRIGKASDGITVEINNREVSFDQEPVIYNNRTMVPMRKIFEELGASVDWDARSLAVTGEKGGREVRFTIGQKLMYVNNKAIELDTAPFVLAGRTLVPVRAVAEGLGCDVSWNGSYRLVSITPRVFEWSEWSTQLPGSVDRDLYYVEERDEYRYRTREKEYFTLSHKTNGAHLVRTEKRYGSWSEWSRSSVSASDTREVEKRFCSIPKKYLYAHYCTGNEQDESIRYKTATYDFCHECAYHALGWFDYLLPMAEDGVGYIQYNEDGTKYRCFNSCFRWYILDESGGDYYEYRSRPVYTDYTYWQWGSWSGWSSWSRNDPYDSYYQYDNSIDVDSRTVYRYKEKG